MLPSATCGARKRPPPRLPRLPAVLAEAVAEAAEVEVEVVVVALVLEPVGSVVALVLWVKVEPYMQIIPVQRLPLVIGAKRTISSRATMLSPSCDLMLVPPFCVLPRWKSIVRLSYRHSCPPRAAKMSEYGCDHTGMVSRLFLTGVPPTFQYPPNIVKDNLGA